MSIYHTYNGAEADSYNGWNLNSEVILDEFKYDLDNNIHIYESAWHTIGEEQIDIAAISNPPNIFPLLDKMNSCGLLTRSE